MAASPGWTTTKRVRGFIHDVAHLLSLDDDTCNVVFLSDRSLYLLTNLALLDATFLTRYGVEFDNSGHYIPLSPDNDDYQAVIDAINDLEGDLMPQNCDLATALESIATAISAINPCCGQTAGAGTEVPPSPIAETPAYGEGEDFETLGDYLDYKCDMAASITWQFSYCLRLLYENNVDGYFGVAVATVLGLLTAVLTLAGLAEVLSVLGGLADLALALITGAEYDLERMYTDVDSATNDLVCYLYSAASADDSQEAFLLYLSDDLEWSSAEMAIANLLLLTGVCNRLYSYQPEKLQSGVTGSCAACAQPGVDIPMIFQFGSGQIDYSGQEFTLYSEPWTPPYHILNFYVTNYESSPWRHYCIEFVDTNITYPEGTENRRIYCQNASHVQVNDSIPGGWFGDTLIPPPAAAPVNYVAMTSATGAFWATFKIVGLFDGGISVTKPSQATGLCE